MLSAPNELTQERAKLYESARFNCPYKCGEENLELQMISKHAIWKCANKPIESKQQLKGRIYYLENIVNKQRFDFDETMRIMES